MDVNYLLEVQWNWNGNQTKYAANCFLKVKLNYQVITFNDNFL